MKRLLFLLMLAMTAAGQALAQMSDEEIVKYVKEQNDAGQSQTAILLDLQKKGVKKDQLMRLKEKYEAMQKGGAQTSSKNKASDNRQRKANGETSSRTEDSDEGWPIPNLTTDTEEKEIFGHDIFKNDKLSFEPNMNIATPANYVLGSGDEVLVDVFGASQSSKAYTVSPEGFIVVEKYGPISVSGLSIEQAQTRISEKLGAHYQGSDIKVSAGQTRTVLVNVLGEVATPGTYTLSAFATVFNALYMAGGITDIGTLRNIKVSRNGRVISKIDVYDYIMNGKLSGNVMLQDNDAIIVGAYDALVSIDGAIKRPMFYEMKEGEPLQALIAYAGGFNGDANRNAVTIERKTGEGYTVHTVGEKDYGSFGMQDGDSVSVGNVAKRYRNLVQVGGAVFYPGNYSLSADCNSIRTLVEKAGGLTEEAFINRAVLYRMNENRSRRAMSIDLAGILQDTAPDVILENEDSLAIASDEEITRTRKYYIVGPLVKDGEFDYVSGMTLEDAIVAAGGLKENALLTNIEVSRRLQYTDERDTTYTQKAKIYTFDVEDNLKIKGGNDFTLMPFDVITIKVDPEYADVSLVYIGGEVKYPGTYSLRGRSDRISDLVKRAGGLKESGFIEGARFTRALNDDERARAEQLLEMAHSGDTVDIEKITIKDRYSVGIDLVKAMKEPGGNKDIILRSDDQLYIPARNNTVRISGEVLYPNTVAFLEDKSAGYYINQAGGISNKGHRSKAFIIYANGQVSRLTRGKIQPGCEIVVPSKVEKKDSAQKTGTVLAGISTLSTLGAILVTALK